jgi:high-affinity iron transporter
MRRTLAPLLLALASALPVLGDPGELLQLVDYVGVDYPEAVAGGAVRNPAEYAEMQEFARRIGQGVAALDERAERRELLAQAGALAALIDAKAPPARVAELARRMRDLLMRAYPVPTTPRRAPELARGQALYRQSCASCHGPGGRGDGPSAAGLEPPPIDFRDRQRADRRSLHGLYNTITLGVDGTGMASFADLADEDRWALAFFVGSLAADEPTLARGQRAWESSGGLQLEDAVVRSPAELAASQPSGAAMAAWARRHPDLLFAGLPAPLTLARQRIEQSAATYARGDQERALSLAVAAYLEGFEMAEPALASTAPGLVRAVEESMMGYRAAVGAGAPRAEVDRRAGEVDALLRRAQDSLSRESVSSLVAFTSALVILLREGLEAILILAALVALLVRTGRREALAYVHYGWGGALLLGIVTWAAATWLLAVSGATRELTEGITALLAAGILFSVGFWMHDKTTARRWHDFLRERIQRALDGRTLLGISAISFVAVYREVFETVLFYQALWAQVDAGRRGALLAGAGTAALALAALAAAIFRFGLRLPLRQFFTLSAAVMFLLALAFAGKGVAALQEAGKIPISPIRFPRLELLGIYPNLQGLLLQLLLVLAALSLVWWSRRAPRVAPANRPA